MSCSLTRVGFSAFLRRVGLWVYIGVFPSGCGLVDPTGCHNECRLMDLWVLWFRDGCGLVGPIWVPQWMWTDRLVGPMCF